ncbi:MAG: deoxynucleoside kinase [Bacteroidia bacterium]|nr:deoxynucleoside kinase [Bacteroidia bacterium]
MKEQILRHIAVAGNIGAGKTTLVKKLADHYRWEPHLEAVDHNPYLEDFYQDMSRWAFPLQIYFLNSRFNQVVKIRESPHTIIQDRTIYEDAFIFAKNLKETHHLSERDFANYFDLFKSMSQMIHPPDLLIYLRASIPKLIEQISRRGRDYEQNISIRYLEDLNRNYEEWISQYKEGNLLIINVDPLDYVNNPEDFGQIINRIDAELFGLL